MSKILVIAPKNPLNNTPKKDDLSPAESILKNYMPTAIVTTSFSGKEEMQLAETIQPDVILIKLANDTGGINVCEEFKKNINTKHIPIIMITNENSNLEVRTKFMNQGIDAFLSEPIDSVELISLVKLMLRMKKADSGLLNENDNLERLVVERTAELSNSYEELKQEVKIRKLSEEALGKNQQRLELAMKASRVGFFDWNLVTNEAYYSPRWKGMLGYKDSELPNDVSIWETLVNPEGAERSKGLQEKLISRQIDYFEIEFKMKHKAGHWVDVLTRAEAIFDETGNVIRFVGTHLDITERKQAEEEIRVSESALQEAQEIAKIGSWENNLISNELIWSDQMYRLLEIDKAQKPLFELFLSRVHPDDLEYVRGLEIKEYVDDKAIQADYRLLTPSGKIKCITTKSQYILDDSGKIIKSSGIVQDITERKQAEKKLKESELRFKALHNASFGGIAIHDKGKILECNQGLSDISDYEISDLIGMDGLLLIAEEAREKVMGYILAEYEGSYETIGLKKNGKKYSLRLEARMIPYKGKNVRVAEFRDITEGKLAEENLKQRMQELEIFNDASVDRELMINDHRQEINDLLIKLGEKAKYKVVE